MRGESPVQDAPPCSLSPPSPLPRWVSKLVWGSAQLPHSYHTATAQMLRLLLPLLLLQLLLSLLLLLLPLP